MINAGGAGRREVSRSLAAAGAVAHTGEDELIALVTKAAGALVGGRVFTHPAGARLWGVGSDCAEVQPARGHRLVTTTDTLVEGVHFDTRWFSWRQVGAKLATQNLSDLAAAGAQPVASLLSLVVPPAMAVADVKALAQGFGRVANGVGLTLIGGNITRGALFSATLTAFGQTRRKEPLTRAGAKPGDVLCVSGPLGASRAGLAILDAAHAPRGLSLATRDSAVLVKAHLQPAAQVALGQAFAAFAGVHAAMDLSDGLLRDGARMAQASGVRLVVDVDTIPVAPALRRFAALKGQRACDWALAGGEDFQLLVALAPTTARRLANLTPIGRVEAGRPDLVLVAGDAPYTPAPDGPIPFEHFGKTR